MHRRSPLEKGIPWVVWPRRRIPWKGSLAATRPDVRSESHSLWRGRPSWCESHSLVEGDPLVRIPVALERVTLLMRIPFALERVTLLVRIPISWRGLRNWCEFHSLLTRGILWSKSHSLWRGNPFEENTILLEEGTPLKRIPFAVDREVPWGEYHSLGEGNPLEKGGNA